MSDVRPLPPFVAFAGSRRIAAGELAEVARVTKATIDAGAPEPVLVLDGVTSEPVALDVRGTLDDVLARLPTPPVGPGADAPDPAPRGPGRPRLGVVAREVTLLPRHWAWLGAQSGGASVTLRRLVDDARRAHEGADRARRASEAASRFVHAVAGDAPNREEASRALLAGDTARFASLAAAWPPDVRDHAVALAARAAAARADVGDVGDPGAGRGAG